MTREEKTTIMNMEICARLPYGVRCKVNAKDFLDWVQEVFGEKLVVSTPEICEALTRRSFVIEGMPAYDKFILKGFCDYGCGVPSRFIELCLRPLDDMTADAPIPIPAPMPLSIQYTGQIVATAELASTPSPEHHEASAKLLIWTTAYETARGMDIASRAFLGSPSIVSRSFSAVVLIAGRMELRRCIFLSGKAGRSVAHGNR